MTLLANEQLLQDPQIEVYGARAHNLKNIDLKIPRNKLVVITGLSGSGKSSLAFDTIYAEGQRRYMETFSAYARQFIGGLERPDVDKIEGLSPVISIEQKTTNKNPRSTVGTITEVYDFLRLLFARAADAYSYNTGKKMIQMTELEIQQQIFEKFANKKIAVLSPLVRARKGHYRELFEQLRKQGFLRVRIDGNIEDIVPKMQLDRYKTHDIELVVDRLEVNSNSEKRVLETIREGLRQGKGIIQVLDLQDQSLNFYSRYLMCADTGIAYDEPQPNSFSFNSPYGACETCEGIGTVAEVDIQTIIPDESKSINGGALAPLGEYRDIWMFRILKAISKKYKFSLSNPYQSLSDEVKEIILYGLKEPILVSNMNESGSYETKFEGIYNILNKQYQEGTYEAFNSWASEFVAQVSCPSCNGARLKQQSLNFKIAEKNIAELASFELSELSEWFDGIEERLSSKQLQIAKEVLKEIRTRLGFLINIGLEYLTLNRGAHTLSGGESQRIRLATQIGSQLVGVLYILDEPSIGLHQADNVKLIASLKNLRDLGNSIIVVEHDKDMIMQADYVLDMGPGAGFFGGEVVGEGTPDEFMQGGSLTAQYINNSKRIEVPKKRRSGSGEHISIIGAKGNNLKNLSVKFPLGKFICVTGLSGSGKSTLINETLYPILNKHVYNSKKKALNYKSVSGLEHIDKVIDIDQSPIGRTPRSNPATYTAVFNDIRALFSELPEAKIRGYKPGRFSFNVKGGRCEICEGGGMRIIEMNFLPDVQVPCEGCYGKRYNRETLEVRYRGKSISDVLNMSISEAVEFFANMPTILRKIQTLKEVGLGYLTLGQSSTTLSGGEAQRVKLATELSKKDTGKTFYILDEPTTGLHFEDIRVLLEVLQKLVEKGNTILVVEHNLDVIKVADHIIDMGPEGGKHGGNILFEGTPEQLAKHKTSKTAQFLKAEL